MFKYALEFANFRAGVRLGPPVRNKLGHFDQPHAPPSVADVQVLVGLLRLFALFRGLALNRRHFSYIFF